MSNRRAAEAAKQLGLPGIANSDAHVADAVGSSYSVIWVDEIDSESVLKAIREGRVSPVPGRPGLGAIASTLAWSIERRLRRRRRGPSRLDYVEDIDADYFYGGRG